MKFHIFYNCQMTMHIEKYCFIISLNLIEEEFIVKEVVFVTGCSTGIGRDICEVMDSKGYIVVATARKIETLKNVHASLKLRLDVTDRKSIQEAVKHTINQFGKIDILVNNAGFSVRGAMEEVDVDVVRKMFDVNVFGIINMVQEVLPEMRKRQLGKIINIGSISGKFTQAINGGYCASKHAVESINEALRLELKQYNIQSTVIEPGAMNTNFFHTLSKTSDKIMENPNSAYENFYKSDLKYRNRQKRMDSREAAEKICRFITQNKLKPRYTVAVSYLFPFLLKHIPDSLLEFLLVRHFR